MRGNCRGLDQRILVRWNQRSFTKSSNSCHDFISRSSPDERRGMLVMGIDVVSNGGFKFAGAAEYTGENLFFREQRELALPPD